MYVAVSVKFPATQALPTSHGNVFPTTQFGEAEKCIESIAWAASKSISPEAVEAKVPQSWWKT